MSFGRKLKMLRVHNGLNQNQMSKRLNISQSVLSRYESDKKRLTEYDDIVQRVVDEFKVSPKWLVAEDGNTTIFQSGSIATGSQGIEQIENYYSVPKEFMYVWFKQLQQLLEQILNLLSLLAKK
jgi:transcriptional regulator with XRE-family HTH domain